MTSQVIENFLTDDEIYAIEVNFRKFYDTYLWKEPTENNTIAHSLYWYPGDSYKETLLEFINSKIEKVFGKNICDNWHILNAYKPYGIHTDSLDDEVICDTHKALEQYDFGWTFLIPLDNYPTHTIIFNEQSERMKVSSKWIERESRSKQFSISEDTYNQYLTHQSKDLVDYYSIEMVFPWKKGNLLAMPRKSFHCSDNFSAKKCFEKRALIGWSYVPK